MNRHTVALLQVLLFSALTIAPCFGDAPSPLPVGAQVGYFVAVSDKPRHHLAGPSPKQFDVREYDIQWHLRELMQERIESALREGGFVPVNLDTASITHADLKRLMATGAVSARNMDTQSLDSDQWQLKLRLKHGPRLSALVLVEDARVMIPSCTSCDYHYGFGGGMKTERWGPSKKNTKHYAIAAFDWYVVRLEPFTHLPHDLKLDSLATKVQLELDPAHQPADMQSLSADDFEPSRRRIADHVDGISRRVAQLLRGN